MRWDSGKSTIVPFKIAAADVPDLVEAHVRCRASALVSTADVPPAAEITIEMTVFETRNSP